MSNRLSTNQGRAFAAFGAVLLSLTVAACASRARLASLPSDAPASVEAAAAPIAPVGVALAEDPPLPGEPTARWPALAAERAASTHAGHVHDAPDGGSEGGHAH